MEPTNHCLLDELSKFPELEMHALCPEWGIESGNMRKLKKSPRPDLKTGKTGFTFHYATTYYYSRLGSMIRTLKPDILSIHDEPYSLTTGQALAYRAMFSPKSKVVFCSAQNIFKNFSPPFNLIEQWSYRASSAGYGCGLGVKEVIQAKGFNGRFDIIPLGLDPELFKYRQREGKIEGRPFVIGYVGQIVDEKGVFTLMEAFAELKGDAKLVMLGGGDALDRVRAAAEDAELSECVELPGPVPHASVPEIMDTFDILVVPSETTVTWKEQFGRVIAEAFSMGVPVVGSSSGSIPEVIGDAGIIFKEKNHAQLAGILQNLMDHPEQLPTMSEKGLARVNEHYTWKRVAEMTRDLFEYVMELK